MVSFSPRGFLKTKNVRLSFSNGRWVLSIARKWARWVASRWNHQLRAMNRYLLAHSFQYRPAPAGDLPDFFGGSSTSVVRRWRNGRRQSHRPRHDWLRSAVSAAAGPWRADVVAVYAGPVAPPGATGDRLDRCSSQIPVEPGRSGCADSRSADTVGRVHASLRVPAHPVAPAGRYTSMLSAPPRTSGRRGAVIVRVSSRRRHGDVARSPLFFRNLFHHIDLKIPFRQHLLQPSVLGLELP